MSGSASVVLLAAGAALYATGVLRLQRRGVRWPRRRSAAFMGGTLALALAVLPPLATDDERFDIHVAQHLLIAMLAPLLFALSAPVTLLLRNVRARSRPRLVRVLHARPLRFASHPLPAACLNGGSLAALYFTPLYAATLRDARLHELVHVHMLVAGSLFAWAIVAVDPLPGRPAWRMRGACLVGFMAAHAIFAKLLYVHAGALAVAAGQAADVREWQHGAMLMWYGGDALDVAVAVALFHQWYALGGRRLSRAPRFRSEASGQPRA